MQQVGALSLSAEMASGARGAGPATAAGSRGRSNWTCALELNSKRERIAGSETALVDAIRRGADLRIGTGFHHNEHIDTKSTNPELIQEVADFRVTYLVENRWVGGIMTLRQPIELPEGFGERPSMSFFMYNQDGRQAIARPYLDGGPVTGKMGPGPVEPPPDLPKYHKFDAWDDGTNAPSHNFVFDFDFFRFFVNDPWTEVFSHTADGEVQFGSLDALTEEFAQGREFKVGIRDLCADLAEQPEQAPPHEVFVQCGPGYYYTKSRRFMAGTNPLVRVKPSIPLRYQSRNWDFGWLMVRSDGHVARWLVDPYTLKFHRSAKRHALRWFVR